MKHTITSESVEQIEVDAVVVGLYADEPPSGHAATIDATSGGAITRLIESGETLAKTNELLPLHQPTGVAARQVMIAGLGKRDDLDRGQVYRVAATAARRLSRKPRERVAFGLDADWSRGWQAAAVAGANVGCVGQDLYRSEKKQQPFNELVWLGPTAATVERGNILGDAVNLTRRLVNEPPDRIFPGSFAAEASRVASEAGLSIEIWDEKKLEQERCGALLAVARGSERPPRLVIVRHQGGRSGAPPLALVGKGVTFDSGGLSLKTTDGMKTMKCDMAGAGTVLGAMSAIGKLKLPQNVVGLMGLVENMPGGNAFKLGDVVTARNGKTIEVLNTDAEGRLVLADVLWIAAELGADRIIDLATLTGSCCVALGLDVAGLMTNEQSWCDAVLASANDCGERAWQLPMFPEYGEQITSEIADIKNVGQGRWGGAMTAAKLLEEFVDDKPWVHVDIAGPAFLDTGKPWISGGATGAFVQTMVEVVERVA